MSNEKKQRGVWIPDVIECSKALSFAEKAMLSEIIWLDNENGCTASNKYFAERLGISRGYASKVISGLIEKKCLKEPEYEWNGTEIKGRTLRFNPGYFHMETGDSICAKGYFHMGKDKNINNNTNVGEKNTPTSSKQPKKKKSKEDTELHNSVKALIQQYHEKIHGDRYYHDKREAGAVTQIAKRIKANGGLELLEKKLVLLAYRIRDAKSDYDRGLTCTPRRILGEWNSLQPKARQHG